MQEASGRSHQQPVLERSPLKEQAILLRQVVGLKKTAYMHSLFRGYAKSGGDASVIVRVIVVRVAVIVDTTHIIAIAVVGCRRGSYHCLTYNI